MMKLFETVYVLISHNLLQCVLNVRHLQILYITDEEMKVSLATKVPMGGSFVAQHIKRFIVYNFLAERFFTLNINIIRLNM